MLYIVGLGIWDEKDLSLRSIEACKKSKEVYAELYTARWGGNIKSLEKIIGKKIRVLERPDLEEKSLSLIEKAKTKDIAILFPGDPLSATTHLSLVSEAKESRIPVKIIHSSSIFTAVAECGLSLYNFGKTVSIPAPQKGFAPVSFGDSILKNRKCGLHTLCLLDIGMVVSQAIEILLGLEKSTKKKLISDQKVIACSCLGSDKQKILYGSAASLLTSDLGPPSVLIVPGKMHFTEKEFLERFQKGGY
jgi:diphthine synthase